MKFKYFLFIIMSLFFLVSCTTKKNFLIMPSNYTDAVNSNQYVKMPGTVSGESSTSIFFIFPLALEKKEDAVRRAIESRLGCVALIDGTITNTLIFLPPIFMVDQYIIEGTCLIKSNGQCIGNCTSEHGMCISQCGGDGQCIGNCGAVLGRCISRCD